MFEITEWESKKLITIWEDASLIITQESEIITKTTVYFKGRRELLDKSINESENNILKFVSQIRLVFFLLASTTCTLSLRVIRPLFYIVLAMAKFLLYIILGIAKFLLFAIKEVGMWFIVISLKFMWQLLEFMGKLIGSLFTEIKNIRTNTYIYVVRKSLKN
jgi:hypothetical protein